MGIEIIRHKNYFFCLWIQNVGRIFEDVRKVQRRPCLCYDRFPFTRQWLGNHEHICNTVTDIYGIHFFGLPWSAGDTLFLYKLFVRFIYTDNGGERIIWTLVYFQHILHFGHELGIRLWNAPFLYKPRLDFVFFITLQMVLSVMESTTSKRISSSAMACMVQREEPSGGEEQAMAQIRASTSPVTLRLRVVCFFLSRAADSPSMTNRFAIPAIVLWETPNVSLIRS